MPTRTQRDPWRAIWQIVTGDYLLSALLLVAAAGLLATVWLPQAPADDPAAYSQWLSQAQAHFGEATTTLQKLGLFTLTRSFGSRALLALIAGCLSLRLLEGGDRLRQRREVSRPSGEWRPVVNASLPDLMDELRRRRYRVLKDPDVAPLFQVDRWPWANLFPLLAPAGALLLLIGLLASHLWGWRIEGLIVQGGERRALPGAENWVALDEQARDTTGSPGVMTHIEQRGPGARVVVLDDTGQNLPLRRPSDADLVPQLTVALVEDQYFAIPEAQMGIRLAAQPSQSSAGNDSILIQVYRSPPGRLASEAVVQGDAELKVDEVTVKLTGIPYAQMTVASNPGLWPSTIGLTLAALGLLGSALWPRRRFWLRESAGEIQAAGEAPTTLVTGEED